MFFARIFYLTSTFKSWQWHCRAETAVLKVAAIAQKAVWRWKNNRRTIKVAEGWLAYLLSSPWKLCFYLLTYIERFKIVSHLTFDLPFKFNRLAWKVKMIMMVYRAICFWLLLFVPAIYWHTGNDGDSKYCVTVHLRLLQGQIRSSFFKMSCL